MGPSEPVELIRAAYDAIKRGDVEAIAEMLAPDAEWHNPADAIEAGTRVGRDEVLRAIRNLLESLHFSELEPEKIVEGTEGIAAVLRVRAEGRGSGALIDQRLGALHTVHDGKLGRFEWFNDPDVAIAAAGR